MFLELLLIGIVTIGMPARAWFRYRRKEPPAPPARYISETILLIGMLAAILWRRDVPLEALGLSRNPSARWLMDLAICFAVIIAPDIWAVMRIERLTKRGAMLPAPQGLAADALRGRDTGAAFAAVTIVGAIWEELFFRGTIFVIASQMPGGTIIGIVAGSLLFGSHHLRNGPSGMVSSTVFGVVFALLFLITHNLWAVMAAHATGNLLAAWHWGPRIERVRRESLSRKPTLIG